MSKAKERSEKPGMCGVAMVKWTICRQVEKEKEKKCTQLPIRQVRTGAEMQGVSIGIEAQVV